MFTKEEIKSRWAEKRAAAQKEGIELKADINLALEIANASLFDKTTRDGRPYILHPLTVAFNSTRSPNKQIIGILHDVVEDTDWELQDLRDVGFSDRIVDGVDAVTKRKTEDYEEKYFDFVERCGASGEDAIDIKINDLDHNTKKNRTKSIEQTPKQILKEKVYNISYFYLVGIKQGDVAPGTRIFDYIQTVPEYAQYPEIVNQLLNGFSSDQRRMNISDRQPSLV